MIDFVKFRLSSIYFDQIISNKHLEFEMKVNSKTGEINSKHVAYLHNMKIEIWDSKRILISGSLHKLYNVLTKNYAPNQLNDFQIKKGFNGNQYSYSNIWFTLNYLSKKISFSLSDTYLENLEFGFNLSHQFETTQILYSLIKHIGKPFTNYIENYYQVIHSHYIVKAYDKANQYGIDDELIRFELKFQKMEKLNKLLIFSCNDLLDINNLEKLKNLTSKAWSEVFMYDYTINEKKLSKTDLNRILRYKNKNYWVYELANNRQYRDKNKLSFITKKYSSNVQLHIKELIEEYFERLIRSCITVDQLFINRITNDSSNIVSTINH